MALRPASEFIHPPVPPANTIVMPELALWGEANKLWAVDADSRMAVYNAKIEFIIGDTTDEVREKCIAAGIDPETVAIEKAPEMQSF